MRVSMVMIVVMAISLAAGCSRSANIPWREYYPSNPLARAHLYPATGNSGETCFVHLLYNRLGMLSSLSEVQDELANYGAVCSVGQEALSCEHGYQRYLPGAIKFGETTVSAVDIRLQWKVRIENDGPLIEFVGFDREISDIGLAGYQALVARNLSSGEFVTYDDFHDIDRSGNCL